MTTSGRTTATFLGGTGSVTGSKFLLTVGERRILVDCGLFQGEKRWREQNWAEFPVPPSSISDVILTHAHMDHTGYLPALVRNGFAGRVLCTGGTQRLAEIVLRDAAFLQEREAADAAAGGYSKHRPPLPLYTGDDVIAAMRLFAPVEFDTDVDLGDGIGVRFTRAGHILGSASVTVTTPDASALFSGDLGRHDHPVLRARDIPPGAPYVFIESTYGDREHPEPANLPHEGLADVVRRTIARGGSVLVAAFAVDRTSIVLKTLTDMIRHGRIPDVPIYLNSPMALSALDVYASPALRDELRPELRAEDFADPPNLVEVRTADESRRLTNPGKPSIVVSSSGMLTGGRVLHHLEAMLPQRRNAVVLTGYQGVGTRGRALVEGATQLKLYGTYVPVEAEVYLDSEFSVHADASDLIDWLRGLQPRPRTVFCVHGDPASAAALAARITDEVGCPAVVPGFGEVVALSGQGAVPSSAEDRAAARHRPAAGTRAQPVESGLRIDGGDVVWRAVSADGEEIVLEGTITIRLRR
ncbi:MBL fold metallo-hydrolase RNA specificity domain-containing protein [Propionicicella superfundia]|uniref:MBL fold metallo-hydrolase RNA specificity domain-containing protein n=1 Tax=Propionicicella superfundia TaxID=348582 RepID=UPI000404D03A|nr:MBL fold metallo-hydrolase [Propionicicella superfundia]